ncbi:hypothetical protein [Actinoplanes derwentensis]|uniref:Uncharacterized protein n=1 Tax=Actinoplanes derwentensis TaxID=113562 RepID=A0A1H1VBE8_9ACTN|nr:hypothetical protein [Actinoplanes derwentensis]GID83754.1 hypothetical protein Ade03nite_26780 [Actinoplanes derwentensis]SDS82003.1 hypothetical protein SAMN04489716_1702 [Actinoplanes derwentensis]
MTGAARLFWLAPRMVAAVGGPVDRGGYTYDNRDMAERFTGRAPILRKLAAWADDL